MLLSLPIERRAGARNNKSPFIGQTANLEFADKEGVGVFRRSAVFFTAEKRSAAMIAGAAILLVALLASACGPNSSNCVSYEDRGRLHVSLATIEATSPSMAGTIEAQVTEVAKSRPDCNLLEEVKTALAPKPDYNATQAAWSIDATQDAVLSGIMAGTETAQAGLTSTLSPPVGGTPAP
ncbi:hypothetical protein A2960_02765 [Candidatus Gottesmanbacteria bacterium RIFCSPLOWO2_01_FULL_39_12b]|uniref:Uncharacterized protein n=1 Tax=Candidatus Gottesmanbacteria bacterium RIFCSPLOWO2_01_FULL_39_12b TaxID=1798388 RepID=A0A1F6ARC1_9BACT|nr:MAG: hypothetical protein A2960_02765 [Candidatus Gottesmanbacteria bacterium RIFCSPLOWO2_01_FULL_39_12b]